MANYLAPDPLQSTFLIPGSNTPGNGVQLFLYVAGTNTKQTAYQGPTTSTAWSNPIVLDSGGNLPSGSKQVWLVGGQSYKAVYAPSNDTDPPASPYLTQDNLTGINDPAASGIEAASEWVLGTTPTFVSVTSFTVVGDQTTTYTKGRRIKATVTAGTVYGTITNVAFTTLTTVTVSGGALDSGLSAVYYGLLDPANPSISFYEINRKSSTTIPAATTTDIWAVDGDSVHITGSSAIASFGVSPYAGATKKLIFDSTPPVVTSTSQLLIPPYGATTFTMAASTVAMVYADTSRNLLLPFPTGKQTRTVLTSSSGTYSTPSGVVKIYVRLAGGGGGGSGRDANNGNNGSTTTFGSVSATGGAGGSASQASVAGGQGSGGDLNLAGGGGSAGAVSATASVSVASGAGGNNPFGGGGAAEENATGASGAANTGGGGAGGGGAGSTNSGGGGGAGGYAEKLFNPPSSTYAYAVGPGGTGGAAGGQGGGNGGSGVIIIDEYYF